MEQRLEAAAYNGDVTLLRQLLGEDSLLLHGEAYHVTPLHIAALLGHSEFVREVIAVNPGLARSRNGHALTALHLAAKEGHFSVVKELLQACRDNVKELCSTNDNEGFLPIHTAAVHGRIDVLKELLTVCPESAEARTAEGDSIFHLAVKSNSSETVQFLLDWNEAITTQLLCSTDDKGNTILHVAVARKQLHTVKLLLRREGVDVNAINKRGCTTLDVLIDSPGQHGDLVLGEQIRAAGGKTAAELQGDQAPDSSLKNDIGFFLNKYTRRGDRGTVDDEIAYNNQPGTLMLVATLIATFTFQAGINPPGGFKQKDEVAQSPSSAGASDSSEEGEAVLSKDLSLFLLFDMIGLFASLSIILLLLCHVPGNRKIGKMVLGSLKWILWLSVFFTALAFTVAVIRIFHPQIYTWLLLLGWFAVLYLVALWVSIRVFCWLWSSVRQRGRNESQGGLANVVCAISKIVIRTLAIVLIGVFWFLNITFFIYVEKKATHHHDKKDW